MYTNNNYNVIVSEYAKKHYIKSFWKKYKSAWYKTNETIIDMLSLTNKTFKAKYFHKKTFDLSYF